MAVRRIVVDPDLGLTLGPQPEGIEVGVARRPLDPAPLEPNEVLVVSADQGLLAEAGRLGVQRVVAGDDPAATEAAVQELIVFLDR